MTISDTDTGDQSELSPIPIYVRRYQSCYRVAIERQGKRGNTMAYWLVGFPPLNRTSKKVCIQAFCYACTSCSCRPVEWSRSSVIFTAHPTQPLVIARHFSSSKEFVIPSPSPIITSPASYEPPTIISVAPDDSWLFAYFPQRDSDGTGCLWKRDARIDNWNIKEWWSFAQGAGVVAVSWLGVTREVSTFICKETS